MSQCPHLWSKSHNCTLMFLSIAGLQPSSKHNSLKNQFIIYDYNFITGIGWVFSMGHSCSCNSQIWVILESPEAFTGLDMQCGVFSFMLGIWAKLDVSSGPDILSLNSFPMACLTFILTWHFEEESTLLKIAGFSLGEQLKIGNGSTPRVILGELNQAKLSLDSSDVLGRGGGFLSHWKECRQVYASLASFIESTI